MELKRLYFNLVYVFLFSSKTWIYKQNTHTYTQSGAENSLFQFCLTITKPFSPFYLEEMKNACRVFRLILVKLLIVFFSVCVCVCFIIIRRDAPLDFLL